MSPFFVFKASLGVYVEAVVIIQCEMDLILAMLLTIVDDDDNISHLWEVKGLFRGTLPNYRKLRITESHNHDLSKTVK